MRSVNILFTIWQCGWYLLNYKSRFKSGYLFDVTKRYDWSFVFCGICLFISGVMMLIVPLIKSNKIEEESVEYREQAVN